MDKNLEASSYVPRVLIAASENWESLAELPYVLNKGGCIVDVFCSKGSWLTKNSFFHNWIEVNETNDLVESLIQRIKSFHYEWIILGDESLLKKFSNFNETEAFLKRVLPLTKIQNRKLLGSKIGLAQLCEKYNFDSPRTCTFNKKTDFISTSCNLNFPVLLKTDLSWGGGGIIYCKDGNSLISSISKLSDQEEFLLQEFLPGEDIAVEALFKEGRLLTFQCSKVLEYQTNRFGSTISRLYFNNLVIEEIIKNVGCKIGINGFASMQFVGSNIDDKYYLIEVDLRPQAWIRYGDFTGANFSIGVKRFTGLLPLVGTSLQFSSSPKTIEVVLFHRFLISLIINKNLASLFRFIIRRDMWRFIPLYDKVLMKAILNEVFSYTKRALFRRIVGNRFRTKNQPT